ADPATPGPRLAEAAARGPGPAGTARREAVRRGIRAIAPARRMALRGDALSVELRLVAAAPESDDAGGLLLAERIATFLGRSVAVSRPFTEAAGRSTAEADARVTLEAVEALAAPPRVGRADRLPAYRLLGSLRHLPDGERQARLLLAPLLVGRADVRRERLETLRAVLDHPDAAEAAAALGVHRNTIAYRVRRIEEATGWRLTDPDLRLPLALALRLVHEEQVP
ncbi:MAG TPA: helix-turn-helix domain-containing protein, partial [Candidatus Limnocylindrales bacterium]|nr:helix-turn-helix domain-containing protein [Candidatus Limnocylindrales bacterium]